ncbi:MAG: AraC family transcriptional regulator, partial [Planctomycetota bacterium]
MTQDARSDANEFCCRVGGFEHGRFRLSRMHPRFRELGPIGPPTVVFPREAVRITQQDADPVVTDPTVVVFYNARCTYTREALGPRGDRCEWFSLPTGFLDDHGLDPERPFARAYAPSHPSLYAEQRRLTESIRAGRLDALETEERLLDLLTRATNLGIERCAGPPAARAGTARAHRELAEETRRILATRFAEPLTLASLARSVHSSPHHLARVFRAQTGSSIHACLRHLRLTNALEMI